MYGEYNVSDSIFMIREINVKQHDKQCILIYLYENLLYFKARNTVWSASSTHLQCKNVQFVFKNK